MPDAWQVQQATEWGETSPGHTVFRGENRAHGALITFVANDVSVRDSLIVEVRNGAGATIRRYREHATNGINRFVWNLRMDGYGGGGGGSGVGAFSQTPTANPFAPAGAEVLPGEYTVILTLGNATASGRLQVHVDPRITVPLADRQERLEVLTRIGTQQEVGARALRVAAEIANALERASSRLEGGLRDRAAELRERAQEHRRALATVQGITRIAGAVQATWERPTRTMILRLEQAEADFRPALDAFNQFLADEVAPFRLKAGAALADVVFPDLAPVEVPTFGGAR
jgi:hypothetical protein